MRIASLILVHLQIFAGVAAMMVLYFAALEIWREFFTRKEPTRAKVGWDESSSPTTD